MNTCPKRGPLPAAVTVMAAVPLWPSLVAVIVAVPTAPPVTSPLPLTLATPVLLLAHVTVRPPSARPLALPVATDVLLLAQVTLRPLSGLPFPSFGVAVSWTVLPSFTDADAGATVTAPPGTKVT